MAEINICRDNKDLFYRYKMPPIVSKIEGRGNGIKTAVVNTSDVARALSRPPAYIIKYFGFELGAQTKINESDDRYLVNGVHEASKLQDLLDGFISKFVLCASCQNPETDLIKLKDDTLVRDCKACGQRTPVDMRHKLASYIIKHPPETVKRGKGKKAATASADVGGATTDDLVNGDVVTSTNGNSGNGTENDESADEDAIDTSNIPKNMIDEFDENDDDNWAVDMSAEAVAARKREVEASIANLSLEDDADNETSKYNDLGTWITESVEKGDGVPSDVEIYKKCIELGIVEKHKTVQVLAQALISEETPDKDIAAHAGLLSKLVTSEKHEKALLGGIERLVGLQYPSLMSKLPNILHVLYDKDIVCEETFLTWGSHVSKKYVDKDTSKKVKKAAKPFIEWLTQASEEESSDEE